MKSVLLTLALAAAPAFSAEAPKSIELTPTNHVSVLGPIDGTLSSKFIKEVFESSESTLYLYINSPGGSIFAGLEMIQAMKASGKRTVCVANFAASMAFIIFQHCDERLITHSSVLMQHSASYGTRGSAPQVLSFVKFIESMLVDIVKAQADRIGMPVDEFNTKTVTDWWLYDGQALDAGVADAFTTVRCSAALTKRTETRTAMTMFGPGRKYQASACPLITAPVDSGAQSWHNAEAIKDLNMLRNYDRD